MGQILESIFIEILNMSLTASVIIAAVFWTRVLLKKAPRIYTYLLWGIVLFRLICPISFESDFSLLGVLQNESAVEGRMEYIPQDIGYHLEPEVHMPIEAVDELVNSSLPEGTPQNSVNPLQIVIYLMARIWVLGISVMVIHSVFSLWNLRKHLKDAVWENDNIYRMHGNHSPFVYGIFGPCIYLPEYLEDEEQDYVLLHEQIHIRRGDHFYRMLAYIALCIHWFNPLVWLAFSFSGRDMEVSCDEAVIRTLGNEVKKKYSSSLLNLACGDKIVKGIPVAFGESDTGNRIKHILKYQKPAKILVIVSIVCCGVLGISFMANPVAKTYSVYGVIGYADMENEGIPQRIVTIPGNGDIIIPGCEQIIPYEKTENRNLDIGDLIKITFKNDEVGIQETYPGRFTEKAKTIEVLEKNYSMEYIKNGIYRLGIPLEGTQMVNEGYLYEFHQDENVLDSYEIKEISEGNTHIYLEVDSNRLEGIFEFIESDEQGRIKARGELEEPKSTEQNKMTKLEPANPQDGTYVVNIRSISRSDRCIERYVADTASEDIKKLFFANDCVFEVNTSMSKVDYKEVTFEEFADYLKDKKEYTNAPCTVTFEEGRITKAVLQSVYITYGISYQPFVKNESLSELMDRKLGEDRPEHFGIATSARKELSFDISDRDGEEIIAIREGTIGSIQENCGLVEFRSENGEKLYTEYALLSRVGWNNIYLGEAEGVKYILTLHIEDRDTEGIYDYQVFRLGGQGNIKWNPILGTRVSGEVLQLAGSGFEWGDKYVYRDDLFKEWVSELEYYLEHSFLILSSQNGELRTEQICELDKYNYETLKRE